MLTLFEIEVPSCFSIRPRGSAISCCMYFGFFCACSTILSHSWPRVQLAVGMMSILLNGQSSCFVLHRPSALTARRAHGPSLEQPGCQPGSVGILRKTRARIVSMELGLDSMEAASRML